MTKHPNNTASELLDTRTHRTLAEAQQALIDALAEGDPSRSASALAELRLALRASEHDGYQARQAVDELGRMLLHCHGIHEHPRRAA